MLIRSPLIFINLVLLPLLMLFSSNTSAMATQDLNPISSISTIESQYINDEDRLLTIGYRLSRANVQYCAQPDIITGITFHDIGSYDPRYRSVIISETNLGMGFGILYIAPDSAAHNAGLNLDDEVIAINGINVTDFATQYIGAKGSYKRVGLFIENLDNALKQGPTTLTIKRHGEMADVSIIPEKGCGGSVVYINKNNLNAWSDGRYIAVTPEMLKLTSNDSELAFVIAHEMAHNILHHAELLKGISTLFAQFGIGSSRIKITEIQADDKAIDLMINAGFDINAPEIFLKKASRIIPFDFATTHPGIDRRINIVRAAIDRNNENKYIYNINYENAEISQIINYISG
jgi:hypothetical protein